MRQVVTRRTFLKLSVMAASAAAFARLLPGKAVAAVRACIPVAGLEVPMGVPFVVGDDCAPRPTVTATASATRTPTATATGTPTGTVTATQTPTSTPTATPSPWLRWLPLMLGGGKPR